MGRRLQVAHQSWCDMANLPAASPDFGEELMLFSQSLADLGLTVRNPDEWKLLGKLSCGVFTFRATRKGVDARPR